jgi:ribosome-binding protein aMBF1 (putative translation factor)
MTLNANTQKIAALLQQKPPLSHSEIAKQVGVDRRRVYQVRKYLAEHGECTNFDPKKLNYWRSYWGWSLRETARRAKVSVSQISRWESGKSQPQVAQWKRLATGLGIRPSELRKRTV